MPGEANWFGKNWLAKEDIASLKREEMFLFKLQSPTVPAERQGIPEGGRDKQLVKKHKFGNRRKRILRRPKVQIDPRKSKSGGLCWVKR